MKSSRLAGKRGLSKALASTTQLARSAHPVKPPVPPPPAARSRGSHAHVAVAELDPSELLQLEGVDCIAEPASESYGAPAAKRTSGK
jgi:hypothetical protein